MLPLAERPAEPGPRDGAESFRAGSGSGSLDERWARLGVFPSGNGRDEDRTQMLPPTGGDDRTEVLPGTGGRPGPAGPSGTPWHGGEDRTQVLPGAGVRPGPSTRPGPAGGVRPGDGPGPSAGRGGFDAFRKPAAPAPHRSADDAFRKPAAPAPHWSADDAFRKPAAPAAHRPADDAYDSERTTALRVPRPAAAAAPAAPDAGATTRVPAADAGSAVRDPWQEDPGTAEATHDPHEVTVQLDAVQIGAGGVLRRSPGAGAAPEAAPVFVDESGRRNRLYRRIGLAVGLACAGYAVVMVATLLSGNSDAPWMPVPGQEEKPSGQVGTTPRPSATDPVPSSGTSLDPGAAAEADGLTCVDLDFRAAGELCVDHLAGLGHRTVALVGSPPEVYVRRTAFARRLVEGFTAAVGRHGLASAALPCAVAERLLRDLPALTAVVVHNEPLVDPLIEAFEQLGMRVPGDLSLTAVCPAPVAAAARVPVTSVAVPAAELGARAVHLLIRKLSGAPVPGTTLLSPRLTERASTAPRGH